MTNTFLSLTPVSLRSWLRGGAKTFAAPGRALEGFEKTHPSTTLRARYLSAAAIALIVSAGLAFAPRSMAADQITAVSAPATVQDSWWTAFGDPQLNAIISQALDASPDLAAASGRLYKAQAYLTRSQAARYPTATFLGGGLGLGGDTAVDSVGLLGLNFGYEFDFWGKNRAAIKAASNSALAAQADAAEARLVLTTAISEAWIDLARLYEERDLAMRAVALKKENLALVGNKHTQGLTSDAEVQLASAGWYNAQSDLSALDEQIGLTRNRIAALAGQDPAYGNTLSRPALTLPQTVTVPERIDLNLIGRRPDVAAARLRAEAAEAGIDHAHAAFYPNINLMAFAGRILLGSPIDMGQTATSAGPAVTLPLFDGGKLKGDLKAAEGDHAIAIASYNATIVNAMHEAADAVTSQTALGTRLAQSHSALQASENAYSLVKSRYEGGLTDYATLLLAEQSVIAQRRAVADLGSRALTLDVALIKAVGGSYLQSN